MGGVWGGAPVEAPSCSFLTSKRRDSGKKARSPPRETIRPQVFLLAFSPDPSSTHLSFPHSSPSDVRVHQRRLRASIGQSLEKPHPGRIPLRQILRYFGRRWLGRAANSLEFGDAIFLRAASKENLKRRLLRVSADRHDLSVQRVSHRLDGGEVDPPQRIDGEKTEPSSAGAENRAVGRQAKQESARAFDSPDDPIAW